MLRFPISSFIRSLSQRSIQITAGVTLVFALVAGLGCDENAPTETLAPAPPTTIGTGGDDPDLALGDITAMGTIALPINQSIATTPPAPAFRISQTGTGPNGIFQINNTSNNRPAVQGLTNGIGRAGYFQLTNATNSQSGIEVTTAGTGRAGFFQTTNSANTQPALQAQTNGAGFAVHGLATGIHGRAAVFEVTNTANVVDALVARTNGHLRAGFFSITNTANFQPALDAATNGSGWAVRGRTTGTGRAGEFDIHNADNSDIALVGFTGGVGPAGHFEIQNETSGSPALKSITNGSGPAGLFIGNVTIQGTLTKSAGSFRIDHPVDPEHKYLSHSFVESPDMKNVYDGTVTLDAEGRASVELPEYFEALNKDFRYQLTAVGAPGPNLYIAEGVKQNRFRIAGGRPYARVSWQVTGVRQDAYANEHRIKVEEDKPREEKSVEGLVARR